MLCPKCKTEGMVKRDKGMPVWVCRNRNCTGYKKPIRKTQSNSK